MEETHMVFEQVKKMIASQLNISEDKITMNADIINDLKADSLDVFQMIMALEEDYKISIPDDKAQELKKVSDIVGYIESVKK